MGISFDIVTSSFEEELDNTRSPEEVAKELGLGKALAVAKQHPDALVIGSDTIASIGNEQLGKPQNEEEARQMLYALTERASSVTTSVALVCQAQSLAVVKAQTTEIIFKPLDKVAVETYLRTGDWRDKAGAFGIQSGAAPLIERIEGDYDTIVGLPTRLLAAMLAEQGIAVRPVSPPKSAIAFAPGAPVYSSSDKAGIHGGT